MEMVNPETQEIGSDKFFVTARLVKIPNRRELLTKLGMNHESSYSPPHGCAQQKKKENPGATSAVGGMAPALEHGHQSNAKENDRGDSNRFDPHMCTSLQEVSL
jgi:hypothetical protein